MNESAERGDGRRRNTTFFAGQEQIQRDWPAHPVVLSRSEQSRDDVAGAGHGEYHHPHSAEPNRFMYAVVPNSRQGIAEPEKSAGDFRPFVAFEQQSATSR